MWFGNKQSQRNPEGIFGSNVKPPSPGQALKFLFLPDFKNSASQLKGSGQAFARIVAFVFAQQGLFPRNHPTLRGDAPIALWDVFLIAYHNLRWTKNGAPQIMFFFAVLGMLLSALIAIVSMGIGFLLHHAHAGPFDFAGSGDISCQIISYLFLYGGCGNTTFYAGQGDVQAGISSVFSFYSNCMLVFAAFILLYHLIAMVAETAHQGVIGGKKANQIWAPIRLIIAVGLLVPVNGNLSTGQKIVVQIASWGSGMGSQAWITFLSHIGENGGIGFTIAGNTDGGGSVVGMVRNYACMHAYNKFIEGTQDYRGKDKARIVEEMVGTNTILFTNRIFMERAVCGGYRYPTAVGSGVAAAVYAFQAGIFAANKGAWSDLGDEIQQAFHPLNDPKPEPPPDGSVTALVDAYEAQATFASIAGSLFGLLSSSYKAVASQSASMGWPAAGAFLFAVAKGQHATIDGFATSGPSVMSPDLRPGGTQDKSAQDMLQKVATIMENVDRWIQNRGLAATSIFIVRNNILLAYGAKYTDLTFNASLLPFMAGYAFQQAGVFNGKGVLNVSMKSFHPLVEFVGLGQRWLQGSLKLMGIGVAMSAALTESPGKAGSNSTSTSSFMGNGRAGAVGAALLVSMAQIGITMGILIAFYVPLIPFIKFLYATLAWTVAVFESVLAIPVIAIAHLTVDGEHLPGKLAMQAYFQIMAVFLKPLMVVMGLVCGLLCFAVAAGIMDKLYFIAVANSGGANEMIGRTVFAIMYMLILYTCANASFKTIDFFAGNAVRWIGANSWFEKMGDEQFIASQLQGFGGSLGMNTMQNMNRLASSGGHGLPPTGGEGSGKNGGGPKRGADGSATNGTTNAL